MTEEEKKQAKKEYQKKWREENKEKIKDYVKGYKIKNNEKVLAYKKKYRDNNKEKLKKLSKTWKRDQTKNRKSVAKYRNNPANKVKINQHANIKNKKAVLDLTDYYIIALIKQKYPQLTTKLIKENPTLIELERLQIINHRIHLKEQKNGKE